MNACPDCGNTIGHQIDCWSCPITTYTEYITRRDAINRSRDDDDRRKTELEEKDI